MTNEWANKRVNISNIKYNNDFSSQSKSSGTIITNSDLLLQNADYKKVKDVIERLIVSGISRMGEGYCISVSDIAFNMLNQAGIKCHLMEVQLSAVDHIDNKTYMVGFQTSYQQGSHLNVDTHVVVVTDTEIPMIVDLSIAHRLPQGFQCIIDKAINEGDKVVCKVELLGWTYIYQEKKTGIGVPMLHQISILERINTDRQIFDSIKSLKALNYVGIVLSIFAFGNVVAKLLIDWYN